MKKKDLKRKIISSFSDGTPDLLPEIERICSGESQYKEKPAEKRKIFSPSMRRVASVLACLVLFVSGIVTYLFVSNIDKGETYGTTVYIDVNPSIRMYCDKDNKVVTCTPANQDADEVLAGLDLYGSDMNEALNKIVGSIYRKGYLSDSSNSILVSVDYENKSKTGSVFDLIKNGIEGVFSGTDYECSVLLQELEKSEELKKRADEYNVSPGKMYLVEKMINGTDTYSVDDTEKLSGLSINQLNFLYSNRKSENSELFEDDISLGEVSGYIKKDDAINRILTFLDEKFDFLQCCDSYVQYEEIGNEMHMVFEIEIVLKDDMLKYHFKVDCETGIILKHDFSINIE